MAADENEIVDGAEIDTDTDSETAEEQGNAGEDTADDAGAGYGDDKE
jgi:hypothetical protein